MKIRNKILLYFSTSTIVLVGVLFITIYWLSAEYREEEFQQRQREKILTTLHFISEIEKNQNLLTASINRLTINSLLDEKLFIFDDEKKLIYSSLDDVSISYSYSLLNDLNERNTWIERKDGLYDVVAIYFQSEGKGFYGISKAFDQFGYSKLEFLLNSLIIIFILFSALILVLSIYLSNVISNPIIRLAELLGAYKVGLSLDMDPINTNSDEIVFLKDRFLELTERTNKAYLFQKNSIHHISHQLKTPIAILISEIERINRRDLSNEVHSDLNVLLSKAIALSDIINTLLEIAKIESGYRLNTDPHRVDEIIFDSIAELNTLNPDFLFEVNYIPDVPDDASLIVNVNEMLIHQVFQNLLNNCINYSDNKRAMILLDTGDSRLLKVLIKNKGKTMSDKEAELLFEYFFRGENSHDKMGFGLGLTLSKTIMDLHGGKILYHTKGMHTNVFEVQFPYNLR